MTDERQNGTRQHERYAAVLKVDFDHVQGLAEYTENLSEEGVFIATEQVLEPGTPIEFQLSFPGLVKAISLAGTVIWRRVRRSIDDTEPPGIGVKLQFASDVDRQWLIELLKKMAPEERNGAESDASSAAGEYVVLLAEDNPMTRTLFTEALQTLTVPDRIELTIVEAADMDETRQKLSARDTDLLIIEWRLCRELSAETIGAMLNRKPGPRPRTTMVVVGASSEEQQQSLARGADVFLRRPVPAKALLQTVGMLLREAKNQRVP